ncbi:MAG: methyltransferase [Lewinella sp.]
MKQMSDMHRYPPTSDRSLTLFSAADHLLIDWANERSRPDTKTAVCHDRFGAVTLSVSGRAHFLSTFHSQEEALRRNAGSKVVPSSTVLDQISKSFDLALVRIPKSLDLFEYYLRHIARHATSDTQVAAGFMTRHFSPRLLEIAKRYAEQVSQTKARKKARLLVLEKIKVGDGAQEENRPVEYAGKAYRQLPGVFSANRVDVATVFLLDNWPQMASPSTICDLACGSGIIGDQLLVRYPDSRLVATDDSILAVASARINLDQKRADLIYAHTLADLADGSQDLIVTNPPFHFGYEHNMEVSLGLFREAKQKLRPEGLLVIVANRHLNYATHLVKWYKEVEVTAENEKFVVYRCRVGS